MQKFYPKKLAVRSYFRGLPGLLIAGESVSVLC